MTASPQRRKGNAKGRKGVGRGSALRVSLPFFAALCFLPLRLCGERGFTSCL
jgi:hypothetical protein